MSSSICVVANNSHEFSISFFRVVSFLQLIPYNNTLMTNMNKKQTHFYNVSLITQFMMKWKILRRRPFTKRLCKLFCNF